VNLMSTTRTTRRYLTLSASVVLLAAAPGLVGVASATDSPSPKPATSNAQVTLSPDLVRAIESARSNYALLARGAMDNYRTVKHAIRAAMQLDSNLIALHAAKDAAKQALETASHAGTSTAVLQSAYDSARSAYDAAKAPYVVQEDKARSDLKVAIAAAQAGYSTTVTSAFATYAPNTTIPVNLLQASGRGHGFAFGHLHMGPGMNPGHSDARHGH
jgi:hypothetical protein